MPLIRGDQALKTFRVKWSGEAILDLLADHGGRLRIDWAVGVGKSHNMDDVIECAIRNDRYALVIALVPTRQLIAERAWIHAPPDGIRVVDLSPRPRERCGVSRDSQWQVFERNHLGALGRGQVCRPCPERRVCPWPFQYGRALRGARVIYATQTHLERAPDFVDQLKRWVAAERVLVLLDEVNFLMRPYEQQISATRFEVFTAVLRAVNAAQPSNTTLDWILLCENLRAATSDDLRGSGWRAPFFSSSWAYIVQETGWRQKGERFAFLGYALQQFGYSIPSSRFKDRRGELYFAVPPRVDEDFVVYSGTADQALSEFRLGRAFAHPFSEIRFEHSGTRWFNIASRLGTRRYFRRNADQVIDLFAQLTALRMQAGKRVLLIAKKCFISLCAEDLTRRLAELGVSDPTIVTEDFDAALLSAPTVIPLINYGMIGTNLFEHFDCCFCLTGYYVNDEVVDSILQDLTADDLSVPIRIELKGQPLRRTAAVADPRHRCTDLETLAQHALNHQEMGTVLQAVGRVRPYTRPREIITFQCAGHPTLRYEAEFDTLGAARAYFGLLPKRERKVHQRIAQILAQKTAGRTQRQAATALSVSLSTVKRYWNHPGGCHETF